MARQDQEAQVQEEAAEEPSGTQARAHGRTVTRFCGELKFLTGCDFSRLILGNLCFAAQRLLFFLQKKIE